MAISLRSLHAVGSYSNLIDTVAVSVQQQYRKLKHNLKNESDNKRSSKHSNKNFKKETHSLKNDSKDSK